MIRTGTLIAFLALLTPVAHAEDFQLNGRNFTVPDGLEVELVAGPPLVDRPIVAAVDEKGRLYAADSSGSNEKVQIQLETRPHKIVRLEDTDGDGRYDRRTIFADRMMFPSGAMWLDGSLYVSAPPSIWKLTDRDGDGVAEERVEWFQGKTLTGCANDLHGPYRGLDGWIYWTKGAFAEQTYPRPGKPPFVTKAAHIFRARPDGSGIEPVMTGGMDNPVDVAFTPGGERIFTTTFLVNPEGGQRDGLIHAIYGGVYGKIHEVIDGHPRTRPEMMPTLVHLGPAAPSGLARYESSTLGPKYRDNLFACQFNLRKVSRHVLVPDGATFKTEDSDFLVSPDGDFHPTDVIEDFDGSVLVVDTGGWYKLCCPTSQLGKPDVLGGIYRVKPKWKASKHDANALFAGLEASDTPTLVAKLGHSDAAIRGRSADILAKRGKAILGDLKSAKSPEARLQAVWLACRIEGDEARAAVRTYLDDPETVVAQAACQAVSVHRDRKALPKLLSVVQSSRPDSVRRSGAEAIGRIGDGAGVAAILKALTTVKDPTLAHSLTYALIEIGIPDAILPGLASADPRVRRASLVALDQLGVRSLTAQIVAPDLGSKDPSLREAAAWIVDRHPDWGGALAGSLGERLKAAAGTPEESSELASQLARFAGAPEVQRLLVEATSGESLSRSVAVRAMGQTSLKEIPSLWIEALTKPLPTASEPALREMIATIRSWPAGKGPAGAALGASLRKIGDDEARPADLRLQALAAIPGGVSEVGPKLLDFLRSRLASDHPVIERLAAADILARARLKDSELSTLAESIVSAGPLEVDKLLTAFESSKAEPVGLKLVAALGKSDARGSLRVETLKPRLAKFGPAVEKAAEPLLASLNVDAAKQKEKLEGLLAHLSQGDVRRGQAVFNSTKAACRTCHSSGYVGGKVGPDLTRIGGIRADRDLLEAIVFPSLSFVRSYEPVVVATKEGKTFSGIVKKDAADEVILAINANETARIPRDSIEEIRPGNVSVMPAGLDAQLSTQDLADLVAFLKASR